MVFQNYALYPYLTVEANIGFPLRIARYPKAERARRVREVAELLSLVELLERKPGQLSGGQRQRVAMGRALIRNPSVFLMDEPLSNLDAKLRVQMRADIAELQARLGTTTVYVTHDQAEAMTLGHRVAVLHEGRLQQCCAPRELYERPANLFVAGFIGSPAMNLVTAERSDNGTVPFGNMRIPLPREVLAQDPAKLVVGFRPEALVMTADGDGIGVVVEVVEELGADAYAFCSSELPGAPRIVVRVDARRPPARGEPISLRPREEDAHLFDAQTGLRLA
jgi:multiple sugar transport system ATP-binding protein